jgi:hypothetical protein
MDQLLKVVQIWHEHLVEFLTYGERYAWPNPFFLHEESIDEVDPKAMSEGMGVTENDVNALILLQCQLNASASCSEDARPPREVASMLEIADEDVDRFEDFFLGEVRQIHEDREDTDDFADLIPPFDGAGEEEEEQLVTLHFGRVHREMAVS